jgi:hypothetical protein
VRGELKGSSRRSRKNEAQPRLLKTVANILSTTTPEIMSGTIGINQLTMR